MFDPSLMYVFDEPSEVCNADSEDLETVTTVAAKDRLGSREHPKTGEKAIRTTGGRPDAYIRKDDVYTILNLDTADAIAYRGEKYPGIVPIPDQKVKEYDKFADEPVKSEDSYQIANDGSEVTFSANSVRLHDQNKDVVVKMDKQDVAEMIAAAAGFPIPAIGEN